MENLQAYFGDSPSVNELVTPDPRIQGGACRTLLQAPSTFRGALAVAVDRPFPRTWP